MDGLVIVGLLRWCEYGWMRRSGVSLLSLSRGRGRGWIAILVEGKGFQACQICSIISQPGHGNLETIAGHRMLACSRLRTISTCQRELTERGGDGGGSAPGISAMHRTPHKQKQ